MCGRTELNTEWSELAAALGIPLPTVAPPDRTLPALNVPPTAAVPVVVSEPGASNLTLTVMRWGFPAVWAEKPWSRPRFNARAESADRRGAWAEPRAGRRCLVPVTGFYEWIGPRGRRVPMRIGAAGGGLLTLAGVWDRFERDGAQVDCVTVLTTAANPTVAPVHDRMPVILSPERRELWLDPDAERRDVAPLLRPWSGALTVTEADLKRAA